MGAESVTVGVEVVNDNEPPLKPPNKAVSKFALFQIESTAGTNGFHQRATPSQVPVPPSPACVAWTLFAAVPSGSQDKVAPCDLSAVAIASAAVTASAEGNRAS